MGSGGSLYHLTPHSEAPTQVFLPSPDLRASVCCLDPKRLGNQIYREAKTLITGGWTETPEPDTKLAYIWKLP